MPAAGPNASNSRGDTSHFSFLIFDGPELAGVRFTKRALNQEPDFSILHFVCQRQRIFDA
jgi:hypothetical protein